VISLFIIETQLYIRWGKKEGKKRKEKEKKKRNACARRPYYDRTKRRMDEENLSHPNKPEIFNRKGFIFFHQKCFLDAFHVIQKKKMLKKSSL
jgi:hypothetical protein